MCEFKSGISVKLNEDEVDTKTFPLVDSHTFIRKHYGILESDDSLRSSRSTPVELIPQTTPPDFKDMSKWKFVFDDSRPDWWTDAMTEQASRQLIQAAQADWDNHDEKDHLVAVQHGDFTTIKRIRKPSSKVKMAAVRKDGRAIQCIKNPSEAMKLVAVRQYGWAIQYLKNPVLKIQRAALLQDPYVMMHIKKPSLELQLACVKRNGAAIRYINKPSLKVQLAAVRQTKRAINLIDNPSEEVRKAAGL